MGNLVHQGGDDHSLRVALDPLHLPGGKPRHAGFDHQRVIRDPSRDAFDLLENRRLINRPLRGGHRNRNGVLVSKDGFDFIAGLNVMIRLRHHIVRAHDDLEVSYLAHQTDRDCQYRSHDPVAVTDH